MVIHVDQVSERSTGAVLPCYRLYLHTKYRCKSIHYMNGWRVGGNLRHGCLNHRTSTARLVLTPSELRSPPVNVDDIDDRISPRQAYIGSRLE